LLNGTLLPGCSTSSPCGDAPRSSHGSPPSGSGPGGPSRSMGSKGGTTTNSPPSIRREGRRHQGRRRRLKLIAVFLGTGTTNPATSGWSAKKATAAAIRPRPARRRCSCMRHVGETFGPFYGGRDPLASDAKLVGRGPVDRPALGQATRVPEVHSDFGARARMLATKLRQFVRGPDPDDLQIRKASRSVNRRSRRPS
jgi:hypothetical protein